MIFYIWGIGILFFCISIMFFSWNVFQKEILFEICMRNFSSLDFSMIFLLDYFSLTFLNFVLIISFVVIIYSYYYIHEDRSEYRFIIIVSLFVASIAMLILSPTFLGIIIGWDGLGVTSFLLVIYYINSSSLRSGLITIYTNRLGDVAILIAFYYILKNNLMGFESFFIHGRIFLRVIIMFGGITKSAQIPFSAWLPAAIAAPTPVSSLVHSSTLVTAGVYLFIRFFYIYSFMVLRTIFRVIRLLTSLFAGFIACYETDLKKLVAISTLSQLGLIIFIISLGDVFLCYFHMVSHALFKALLFLSCGLIIIVKRGGQDMRFMGSIKFRIKIILIFLILANIRLVGTPFLSGFFSKDLIIEITIFREENFLIFFTLIFSCVLSIVYSLKIIKISGLKYNMRGKIIGVKVSLLCIYLIIVLGLWSIILGKSIRSTIFDGEIVIAIFFDKIWGIIILILGVLLFIIFLFSKKNFLIFCLEIGYLDVFLGDFFWKNIRPIKFIQKNDSLWVDYIIVKNQINGVSVLRQIFIYYTAIIKLRIIFGLFIIIVWFLLYSLKKVWFWRN